MFIQPRDPQNSARLKALSADEAIRCFLEGDFTIGEDSALAHAIQKGLKVPLSIDRIIEVISESWDEELTAEEVKSRLLQECG